MFYQTIKAVTKCQLILTETVIDNEPLIVTVSNPYTYPEIEDRQITFVLNEEVKIEDILISTFNTKTIDDKKYVKSKGSYSYFSVKNLQKNESSTKQVDIKMGKIGIFDRKFLESKYLEKLNEDLKSIYEKMHVAIIKNQLQEFFESLGLQKWGNQKLWDSLVDDSFYDMIFENVEDKENEIKTEVCLGLYPKIYECLKHSLKEEIKESYKGKILYLTDNYEEENRKITDLSEYKHQFKIDTEFWPLVKRFFEVEFFANNNNNMIHFFEKKETGEALVKRLTVDIVINILSGRQIAERKGNTYFGLLSSQDPLVILPSIEDGISAEDFTKKIFESIKLSELIDTFRRNYSTVVDAIIKMKKAASTPYLYTYNFKDFKGRISKYKAFYPLFTDEVKNKLVEIEKSLENLEFSNKNFDEETRVFNLLENESIAFNFKIIFKNKNGKRQSIISKYYIVKGEFLCEIEEMPLSLPSSTPISSDEPVKHPGILNSTWISISIISAFVVATVIVIYLVLREEY